MAPVGRSLRHIPGTFAGVVRPSDDEIEATIVRLLRARDSGKTICPSDAARVLADGDGFRELMHPVRACARDMVRRGELQITQSGRVVDPDTARGAIRLRLPPD